VPTDSDLRPGETEAERDDRNLIELLQELRVAGLGVQVIFAFLLALPFTTRFGALGPAQRGLYVAALVLAAVSTALLLGPVAYHRLVFRRHLKQHLIRAANRMAVAGLTTVALTVGAAVLLVISYVAPGLTTVLISVFVGGLFGGLWFALPLARRWGGAAGPASQPTPPAPGTARQAPPLAIAPPGKRRPAPVRQDRRPGRPRAPTGDGN
jgi:hypothetical protein